MDDFNCFRIDIESQYQDKHIRVKEKDNYQCTGCYLECNDLIKPECCDYFLCGRGKKCHGLKYLIGFGPETEDWYDIMCEDCSYKKQCCRTCGIKFVEDAPH